MKKLKNKLFYLYSFGIYLILALVVFGLASAFLEPDIHSFLVSRFSANMDAPKSTVEIVVTDECKNKYPDWNLDYYIEALEYLHSVAKPKLIGLDFFSPNSVKYTELLKKMDNSVAIFVPKKDFAESDIDEIEFLQNFKTKYALNVKEDNLKLKSSFSGISEHSQAKHLGSAIIKTEESTNKIFSAINILKVADNYYPSLALKMYLLLNETNDIILNPNYAYIPKTGLKIPYSSLGAGFVTTNIKFYNHLNYDDKYIIKGYSHSIIPAHKVITAYRHLKSNGKLDKDDISSEFFNNKIVFFGINLSGPYQDILATPMSDRHPGVDIQATIFDNLMNGHFLYDAGPIVNFLIVFVLSLFTFIVTLKLKFGKSLTLLVFAYASFAVLAFYLAYCDYIINLSGALSVQLVTLVFGYSFKFINESRNKEKIKQAMGKYLSQDIMKNVVSNIDDLKLGGKRAVVTVLFSDIRGFTSMSEKLSAEEVSLILNEYFAHMEPIISKYNGVINKFIGDAVMALFGEPIQDVNHPQNAVRCAYEMLKEVEYLREKWLFEGKPRFEIGVGINTGEVFIGNIGTENRMEYTVIGDTVNLASRIESYNKVYKTNLLISSSTYGYIAGIADVIKISEVQIRGKSKKMDIYEVLRIDKN